MYNRIIQREIRKINKVISEDYSKGRFIPFSTIKSNLKNKAVFFVATGGSATKYLDPELDKKIIITQNSAPYYLIKEFKIRPNFWIIKNRDSVKMFLRLKNFNRLDFSNTILLIPSIQSYSKVNILNPLLKKLILKIPDLKYSTFDEIYQPYLSNEELSYFNNIEATSILRYPKGSSLEGLFIPFALILGISEIFFSGIDQLPTGHFWNKDEPYQNINGKPLDFVNQEEVIENLTTVVKNASKRLNLYRCAEDTDTIFKNIKKISKQKLIKSLDKKIIF